jgi:hypothetical protein
LFRQPTKSWLSKTVDWRGFVFRFIGVLVGGVVGICLFILLVDPYDIIPFSLPIDRRIVSISDRFMYPQIVRSRRFDSLIIGTSTSRLLDPELLDRLFHVRFANLAMSSGMAWEQKTMLDLWLRTDGPPKVLLVGLDGVWCSPDADRDRVTPRGFPYWMYDNDPWKGFLYLFNYGTLEIAVRLVGYHLGLYPERIRYDGYEVFVPPESQYDPVRAHNTIWQGVPPPSTVLPPPLTLEERNQLSFPALTWLDEGLGRLPPTTLKILAFMPVNVAAQPMRGTRDAEAEAECKARIVQIARTRDAKVIDWRITSPLTSNDANYWDSLHYRVPIATRIAEDLAASIFNGSQSEDGSYDLLVR